MAFTIPCRTAPGWDLGDGEDQRVAETRGDGDPLGAHAPIDGEHGVVVQTRLTTVRPALVLTIRVRRQRQTQHAPAP
jgi:hypothetical protein